MFIKEIHKIQLYNDGIKLQGDVIVRLNVQTYRMKSVANEKKTSSHVIASLREHALQRKDA